MAKDNLYAIFDNFLGMDTWHTSHALDLERFNEALGKVVKKYAFNADAMGDYFRQKQQIVKGHPMEAALDKYVARAWAVQEYLSVNK